MASSPDGATTRPEVKPAVVSASDNLRQLRGLLLAPEQSQLKQLEKRLDNLSFQPKDVGRVLPDAIRLRSKEDAQLAQSLSPILNEVLTLSIKKSPRMIVEAISPIMAPAIRKAILSALRGMVQSLNQTLEHSLSWKGLQWRFEAFRTGKPFAEIVLLNTLRFRVEQVFLIHRETGLLLQHVAAEFVAIQDEEVVSGMLTAIQDFVRDSFGGKHSDSLESLRVGELIVWVEEGSKAVLAGVVRGAPPQELREVFQQVLETIHMEFSDALDAFSGDPNQFEETRSHLEDCLQAQFKGSSSQPSLVLWLIVFLLAGLLIVWGAWAYLDHQRWTTFLSQVEQEPGIVVTSIDEENGTRIVNGLRDPLAREPIDLTAQAGLSPKSIRFQFEPYFAVSPHFLLMRVSSLLQPPTTVEMKVEETQLILSGHASHRWIRRLDDLPRAIPGLTKVSTEHLTDTDLEHFEALRKRLESQRFLFTKGSARLHISNGPHPTVLSEMIRELDELASVFGQRVRLEIRGHTSQDGSLVTNKRLRLARAHAVREVLSTEGLTNVYVIPVEQENNHTIDNTENPALSRRVSFKILPEDTMKIEKGVLR